MKQPFKATHMQNKSLTFRWMAVFAIFAMLIHTLPAEPAYSREAILKLLPNMTPPYSKEVWRKLDKLEQLGELAYPVLCQEILAPNELYIIQAIVGVLIRNKGDKKLPLEAIRKLAIQRASDEDTRCTVVEALGKIGTPEDLIYLRKQLADPSIAIQIHAIRSLGGIGGKDSVLLIEAWAAKNSGDTYIAEEASKVIKSISQRAKSPSSKNSIIPSPPSVLNPNPSEFQVPTRRRWSQRRGAW